MPTFSQEQLTALDEAIAQGVLEVKYADKTVTYRSLNEMMRIRSLMLSSVSSKRPSRRLAVHSKGLNGCNSLAE